MFFKADNLTKLHKKETAYIELYSTAPVVFMRLYSDVYVKVRAILQKVAGNFVLGYDGQSYPITDNFFLLFSDEESANLFLGDM